ncbi:MAG: hypothetical protein FWG79_06515 [Bacteroidales bacterium]|nr:hypothetical protein [Bacteroidales bacterium]
MENFRIEFFRKNVALVGDMLETAYGVNSGGVWELTDEQMEQKQDELRQINFDYTNGFIEYLVKNPNSEFIKNILINDFVPLVKHYLGYVRQDIFTGVKLYLLPYFDRYENRETMQWHRLTSEPFYVSCIYVIERTINNYFGYDAFTETATAETSTPEQPEQVRVPKPFSDYLYHNNKDELMTTLHTLLNGSKSGREVAKVLEALVKKGYYPKYTRNTPLVIATFNLSCSRQSITKFFNKTNVFDDDEIQQVVEKLP